MKRQRESDAGEGGPPDADGRPGGGASDTVRQLGQSVLKGMREIQQMKDENVGAKPLVWVDCDPGGDDTFALMWLFALQNKGHCKVIGISTSEGNVRAPLTYAAADKVAMICQSKTQICAQTPLEARFGTHEERRAARLRAKQDASVSGGDATHIHGSDGMGGLSHRMQGSGNEYEDAAESYEALSEALFQYPRQLVLLVIGPHTNLHDAETHEPGIMMLTRDIIIMGGAFNVGGNITPTSEFNIWKDPQAAQTVIQGKGKKSIMIMPLDVTAKMVLTKDLVDQMTRQPTTIDPGAMYTCDVLGKAAFLNDLAQFMIKSNMGFRCTKGQTGFLVHDASTVAFLFYPELVSFKRATVKISSDEGTRGFTYFDQRHHPKLGGGCWVAMDIDTDWAAVMVQDLMCEYNDQQLQTRMQHFRAIRSVSR